MAELAFVHIPVYLWEPDARQWTRWVRAQKDRTRPYGKIMRAGTAKNMRWRMRRATVHDLFEYVREVNGDLASATQRVEPEHETFIRRRLRYVAHPTMREFRADTMMAYVKAVRRVHLALRVAAAKREGLDRVELTEEQIPTVVVGRYNKGYSLVTPLDTVLMKARTIDWQVLKVGQWASREYEKCMRRHVISPPTLITPAKVAMLEGQNYADRGPELGIATGVYGLTIMYVLQALRDPPNLGVCLACRRPFLRVRRSRKQFCDGSCRIAHHRDELRPTREPGVADAQ